MLNLEVNRAELHLSSAYKCITIYIVLSLLDMRILVPTSKSAGFFEKPDILQKIK